jgi:hypothetical protein
MMSEVFLRSIAAVQPACSVMKLLYDDGTNHPPAHPPTPKNGDRMLGLFLLLLQVVFYRCKIRHLCLLAVKSGKDLQLQQLTDGVKNVICFI